MIIEARSISKVYQRGDQIVEALRDVSLSLDEGQFVSIMGPSGSGKSTLLQLLGGLDRSTSGDVLLGGRSLSALSDDELSTFRRRKLGFVFQFFNLLPTLNVLENVALPMLLDGQSLRSVAPRARDLLEMIGLGNRIGHRPDQLSGGEMQRVAVARALIGEPMMILADEPTGNLDSRAGTVVLEMLAELSRKKGQTIVMVTHDPRAAAYCGRSIELRDGRIVRDEAAASRDASRTSA